MSEKSQLDSVYEERNLCVAALCKMARLLGYTAGLSIHHPVKGEDWDVEWRNLVFIELPTGQVAWHIHDSEVDNFLFLLNLPYEYDGHTTEEKYARVKAFLTQM